MKINTIITVAAALCAMSAMAVQEVSLLERSGWVRTCDKGQLVWNDGPEGKSVTLIQEKGAKVAGFGTDFLDLDAFRDKEVDLVFVLDGENVVRGTEKDGKTPRKLTPVTYHWEIQFAEYANWHTPEVPDYPEGTFKGREVVFSFRYPETAGKFGMNFRACCESGKVTVRKILVRERAEKYMDKFMKLPEGFKCEYSDKVLKAPHMRGIVAGCAHSVESYEKIRGWGCNLVRFWMNPDKEGDFEKTDALLPVLQKLGINVILAPATPGPRGPRGQAYRLFNDEALYKQYLANWKRVAERYKGDTRIFAYDLMNEPFQELRANPDDKYNFLAVQYEAAKIVRAIDPDRVLIASASGGSSPGNYNACDMRPLPLKDVIYQMHFYAPFFLTHAGLYGTKLLPNDPYPGTLKRNTKWTKKEVGTVMDYMNDFIERWGAQIYVGEFSCMSIQPGAAQWLDDVAGLIEEHGWKFWTFHSYGEFYGWNLEYKADEKTGKPVKIKPDETTDRLEVLKKWWAKNQES